MADTLWTYASGLIDGNEKLQSDIKTNPKAIFSLMKPLQEKFGNNISVPQRQQLVSYVAGYLGLDYEEVRGLVNA